MKHFLLFLCLFHPIGWMILVFYIAQQMGEMQEAKPSKG